MNWLHVFTHHKQSMGKKKGQRRGKHIPQRTCIVCRQKYDKRRLTRLVRTPDEGIVVDPTGKRNGRGAYLCDQPSCWDNLLQDVWLLNQALKTTVSDAEMKKIAEGKPVEIKAEGLN